MLRGGLNNPYILFSKNINIPHIVSTNIPNKSEKVKIVPKYFQKGTFKKDLQ